MNIEIDIRVQRKFSSRVNRRRLAKVARRAAELERVDLGVTIYVTDDAEIRRLNRQFHATNAPTDVLAFPGAEKGYAGDVVVSYERAREQARAAGWRIADELDLLALHGVLHLLGYDDSRDRARARMWKRQAEILRREIKGPVELKVRKRAKEGS